MLERESARKEVFGEKLGRKIEREKVVGEKLRERVGKRKSCVMVERVGVVREEESQEEKVVRSCMTKR